MSTRELELPSGWKRRLLHLRVLCDTKEPPQLDAADVRRVELALGVTLGDPLLALLSTHATSLREYEIQLLSLPNHTKDVRAVLGGDLIGIGKHPDGNVFLATNAGGTKVHRITMANKKVSVLPTEKWLDLQVARRQESLRDEGDTIRALGVKSIAEDALAAFVPSVVEDETPKRRVQHTKFGEGDVLREFDGKLEIRFETGTKTLMASFVTDV
ncbi:MAG: hypothetical protein ACI9KE_004592 [Polyangiales bacterium]|jgi:hypothetical protein